METYWGLTTPRKLSERASGQEPDRESKAESESSSRHPALRHEPTDTRALRKEVMRQKDMLTASVRGNLGSFLSLRIALIQLSPKSAEAEA